MARENKTRRDERRFGRPERLADIAQVAPWVLSSDEPEEMPGSFRRLIRESVSVDAQNVAEYVASHTEKDWLWTELPSCRLPFPVMFLESRTAHPWSEAFGRTGVLMWEVDLGDALHRVESAAAHTANLNRSKIGDDLAMIREKAVFAIDFGMIGLLVSPRHVDQYRIVHLNRGGLFLDQDGTPLRSPLGQLDPKLFPESAIGSAKRFFWESMFPVMLAVGFMNCKNVLLSKVEPDARLNRLRKKAGLKPFLRYHTINIEPMKRVLKAEGGIETEGLRKALHIVRGHFMRYTPERPLFGKHAGTFWAPSHVRGSLKEGVVVSDYRVNPPNDGGPSPCP